MTMATEAARLYLVTPPNLDAGSFPAQLGEALGGGNVAAVLIGLEPAGRMSEETAATLVAIVQRAGAAALVAEDTRLAGRVGADGVHVGGGLADLRLAIESFRPKRIVGAGNLNSRHLAMQAGEAGADYIFFGRPHGDSHEEPHPKALDLAEWWSEIMEIPAVVMAGRSIESVAAAGLTGAAFVALNDAVWSHVGGPAAAIAAAEAALARAEPRAA